MTDAPSEPVKKFSLDTVPWYAVPAVLLGVPALLAILSAIWPEVFFDGFVDKYYFSPIRGDTGYNPVNTISWAVLLGLCLLGLSQMVNALKVKVDATFIYGAVAWVVTGAIFRVLEDTNMFLPPLQYVMITPPIYLLFAVFAVISLLIGIYVQRTATAHGVEPALQKLWFIQAIFVLVYTLLWAAEWSQITVYLNPVLVALFAALNYFVIRYRVLKVGEVRPTELLLGLALAPFLMSIAYVIQFIVDPWRASGPGIPSSFITVPLLAIGLAGTAVASFRAASKDHSASPKWIIAFAAFFVLTLGIVVWFTTPDFSRTPFDLSSIAFIVALGLIVGGFGVLMARLMRRQAHAFYVVVLTFLVLAGYVVMLILIDYLFGRFGQDPAAWSRHAMAVIVVGYFLLRNKDGIKSTYKHLKEAGGVSTGFTAPFLLPLNIFLVISQVMDGFATSLGLDLAGYSEKHVLSAYIIDTFRIFSENIGWDFGATHPTFLAFVPIKLGISLAVVYAIDVYSKEDAEKYPALIGLVKFAIIMVGIGPAVRDYVRLSLGV